MTCTQRNAIFIVLAVLGVLLFSATSHATVVSVASSASVNSKIDTGLTVNIGDQLEIWADPTDKWAIGSASKHTINADGMVDYFDPATGFEWGSMLGVVVDEPNDTSVTFKVGTDLSWISTISGTLYLYCLDRTGTYHDNYGEIAANISTSSTPLPGAALLLGSGLVGLVGLRRRIK